LIGKQAEGRQAARGKQACGKPAVASKPLCGEPIGRAEKERSEPFGRQAIRRQAAVRQASLAASQKDPVSALYLWLAAGSPALGLPADAVGSLEVKATTL
jgi:hypothetical protein